MEECGAQVAFVAPIRVVDAILTGVHRPGESYFELLEAFTDDAVLAEISDAFSTYNYRPHEFGDSMLIERRAHIEIGMVVPRNQFDL